MDGRVGTAVYGLLTCFFLYEVVGPWYIIRTFLSLFLPIHPTQDFVPPPLTLA